MGFDTATKGMEMLEQAASISDEQIRRAAQFAALHVEKHELLGVLNTMGISPDALRASREGESNEMYSSAFGNMTRLAL